VKKTEKAMNEKSGQYPTDAAKAKERHRKGMMSARPER